MVHIHQTFITEKKHLQLISMSLFVITVFKSEAKSAELVFVHLFIWLELCQYVTMHTYLHMLAILL